MKTDKFYLDLQSAILIADEILCAQPERVLLKYIEKHYKGKGEIIPINVHKNAVGGSVIIKQLPQYEKINGKIRDFDKGCIGTGILWEDIEYVNSDPYETAGGYIRGIAKKGTKCKIYLGYSYTGFHITVLADVNILTDHYNNNFGGVPTGNGTKKYKEGERIENQVVWSEVNSFYHDPINLKELDINKIKNFIRSQK